MAGDGGGRADSGCFLTGEGAASALLTGALTSVLAGAGSGCFFTGEGAVISVLAGTASACFLGAARPDLAGGASPDFGADSACFFTGEGAARPVVGALAGEGGGSADSFLVSFLGEGGSVLAGEGAGRADSGCFLTGEGATSPFGATNPDALQMNIMT